MINSRGYFIKKIISDLNLQSYLEIGLSLNPLAPYRLLELENKTSLDMNHLTNPDFCMSSDNFFKKLENGETKFDKNYKWDCIFIDGWHMADQVYNDLMNSFNHLSDNGIIFMHDVLPWSYELTIESNVGNVTATCQDAWKTVEYCLKNHNEMHICTLEENQGGLAVIKKNKERKRNMLDINHNKFYQFSNFIVDRNKNMNCIDENNLLNWIANPTYNF